MPAGRTPNQKGWPRRKLPYQHTEYDDKTGFETKRDETRPNIWLGGNAQYENNWTSFAEGREVTAMEQRLCVVCGCQVKGALVFLRMWSRAWRPLNTQTADMYPADWKCEWKPELTDGPGGHPRCIHLAANVCPHVTREPAAGKPTSIVAYVTDDADPYEKKLEGMTGSMNLEHIEMLIPLTRDELLALAKEAPLGV